jgi:hypothetical protein
MIIVINILYEYVYILLLALNYRVKHWTVVV